MDYNSSELDVDLFVVSVFIGRTGNSISLE